VRLVSWPISAGRLVSALSCAKYRELSDNASEEHKCSDVLPCKFVRLVSRPMSGGRIVSRFVYTDK
jgi:hypothetical protein